MKLIDQYIYKKFFSTFLVILVIATLLILLIDATDNMSEYQQYKLSIKEISAYYCVMIPYMLNFITPIIVFATATWITIRLSQRSEIIALLSGGVGFNRIAQPYFVIALLLTGANFYLTGWLIAKTNKEKIKFDTQYRRSFTTTFTSQPDYIHLKVGPNQYLYIREYHAYYHIGYHIRLDTFQGTTLIEHVSAQQMQWNATDQTWSLCKWSKREFFPKYETCTQGELLTLPLALDPEDCLINPNLKECLTLPELTVHIQKLIEKGNENARIFIAEKYIRYMSPFSVIILIILGFLVAVYKPRGNVSTQITLGFVLACLYITFFLYAKIVTEAQSSYPLLHIWMPNILFSLLCMIFYKLVPK